MFLSLADIGLTLSNTDDDTDIAAIAAQPWHDLAWEALFEASVVFHTSRPMTAYGFEDPAVREFTSHVEVSLPLPLASAPGDLAQFTAQFTALRRVALHAAEHGSHVTMTMARVDGYLLDTTAIRGDLDELLWDLGVPQFTPALEYVEFVKGGPVTVELTEPFLSEASGDIAVLGEVEAHPGLDLLGDGLTAHMIAQSLREVGAAAGPVLVHLDPPENDIERDFFADFWTSLGFTQSTQDLWESDARTMHTGITGEIG